jgi:hypothetical protein
MVALTTIINVITPVSIMTATAPTATVEIIQMRLIAHKAEFCRIHQ